MQLLYTIKKLIPRKLFKKIQPIYHFILGWLAAWLYRWPSEKLIVIGVTGTTGKSTTVHLIAKMLEEAGYKAGYTSTAMFKVGEKEWMNDKKMTMAGRFFTQKMLSKMAQAGCEYAIIETTSEGIAQFRHRFINYDIALFTGLYPEHIESHGGFENYKQAKGKLFAHLSNCKIKYTNENGKVVKVANEIKKIDLKRVKKTIIVNGDDEHADYFLDFKADEKYEFRIENSELRNNDIKLISANKVEVSGEGIGFDVNNIQFNLQLMGAFNVCNALAAATVGVSQEINLAKIKEALEKIGGVPGRFERIDENQNFTVIVDYAFEPNAVKKLYVIIEMMPRNRVIHVLGSTGGGRDSARRPILGKIAGERADVVIVTNEDPYDDDPQIIIDQVAVGAEKAGKKKGENLFKILDRREAIKKALQIAQAGDVVLITGKGCEQAICSAGGKKIPWDDRKVVREELKKLSTV